MVYEAYPMIVTNLSFNLEEACDETCYLEEFYPHSLVIQIIDAEITISELSYSTTRYENLSELQLQAKSIKDLEKVQLMDQYIASKGWDWVAGDNELVAQYYSVKAIQFGFDKYNVRGFDYFISGEFKYITSREFIKNSGTLRNEFDWKSKHDANVPETPYYNPNGYGWLTELRNQDSCGSCWVFGPVASMEAVSNLYFNQLCNYDLAEQDVLCCSPGGGSCGGGCPRNALHYLNITGTFEEDNYPYLNNFYTGCCHQDYGNPEYIIKCGMVWQVPTSIQSLDTLKSRLINTGPLVTWISDNSLGLNHVMSLIQYYTDPVTQNIHFVFKDSYAGGRIIPYELSWNSIAEMYSIRLPITFVEGTVPVPVVNKWDKDNDGYYNWGIGPKPDDCQCTCSVEEDWNDHNNRIGPREDDYSGKPVKPIMKVFAFEGSALPTPITNHGFYFIQSNPGTINVKVENSGNAQLNLAYISPVSITEEETNYFHLKDDLQPDSKICMGGGTSSFEIDFQELHDPNELCQATVKIQLHSCDSDIYDYFEFRLVYNNNCNFNENAYGVSGYEAWNDYIIMNQNIFIDDGAILEVFGSVAMNEESNILIAAGGQLILNGGLITGSCGTSWRGIDVWGDPYEPQTSDYQGKVKIINSGCIEYAETAIETALLDGYGRYNPSGGIVYCSDAVFKDNVTDINLYPYRDNHLNLSRFIKTKFETTDDMYTYMLDEPNAHVFLDNVIGINFKGCTFGNYSSPEYDSRGKGIESYGADCIIAGECGENILPCPWKIPCRFENLNYGIRAFNYYGYNTIIVDSADFIHNLRGIHMRLIDHPMIINNSFDITDPDGLWIGESQVGLYLDESTTGFVVEENKFEAALTPLSPITFGIYLLNVDTTYNEIYNNNFIKLKRGIQAVGDNRNADNGNGVCLKCNDFTNCQTDIVVTYDETITYNTGIALYQGRDGDGDPTLAAGNRFSNVTSYNYINDSRCKHIDYTYQGGTYAPSLVPDKSGDLTLIPDGDATYSKEASCPSHLGGSITLSLEMNTLTEETSIIASYQDTLLMIIDGGNTDGLNFDILTSFPDEALSIRQELLDESPYLSDTVMISAIEKEDVLPAAMVRDILAQNPQAPKSNKVLNALDNRQDTLPGYMMDEIMEGLNTYGAKELLEQKLGEHLAKFDKAWNKINLYFKNDTTNVGLATDSLMVVYEDASTLSAKYTLALMYLDRDDSANAFTVLNNIPAEFNLSIQQSATHEHYQDLFDILWDVRNDTTGLDSLQIQTLFELSSDFHSVPGLYAANLLIKERLLNYDEPVRITDIAKSAPITEKNNNTVKPTEYLVVFPNPAGNYFIVEYELPDPNISGLITISDIHGKKLKNIILKDIQNQIVIPANEFAAGVYFISLFNGNHMIDTQKLTISN